MNIDEISQLINDEVIKNHNFVRTIYKIHNQLISEELEPNLACCAGCSLCCYQLVSCTSLEWKEIDKYMDNYGNRKKIQKRNEFILQEWIKYRKDHFYEMIGDGTKPLREWAGKKCIFLNENEQCDIYSARPMNCRTVNSTIKCTINDKSGFERFRWNYERYLSELLWAKGHSMMLTDLFLGFVK